MFFFPLAAHVLAFLESLLRSSKEETSNILDVQRRPCTQLAFLYWRQESKKGQSQLTAQSDDICSIHQHWSNFNPSESESRHQHMCVVFVYFSFGFLRPNILCAAWKKEGDLDCIYETSEQEPKGIINYIDAACWRYTLAVLLARILFAHLA